MTSMSTYEEESELELAFTILTNMSNSQVYKAIVWACFSSWYYGYHITELNYPVHGLTCYPSPNDGAAFLPPCLGISSLKYSAITAVFTVGGLVGSTISDRVVRAEGIAGGIAWTGWLNLAGAMCMAAAPHWAVLGLGRFIAGLACGLAVCLVPPYLAQLARATPSLAARSGQVGTMNQMAIVLGIFSSQLFGLLLTGPRGDKPNAWRYVLVISGLASIIQIAMTEQPPSFEDREPAREREREGEDEHRNRDPEAHRDEAAPLLSGTPVPATMVDQVSIRDVLSNPTLRGPAILITTIMCLQQASGVNAVLYYSTPILQSVLKNAEAGVITLGITIVNAVMTLPAVVLIDRLGRRTLLVTSALGMGILSTLLAIGIDGQIEKLSSTAIVAFIAAFAVGLGPVPFLLVSDLMPAHAIPAVSSLALSASWIVNFIVGFGFLPLRDALSSPEDPHDPANGNRKGEGRVFYVFSVMLAGTVVVVLRGIRN